MSTWPLLRFDPDTGEIEPASEETATHVSVQKHAAALRRIDDLERRLREALEANEALDARVAELENRNTRLFEKHRQALSSKASWRARALKQEGDEPARRMLGSRQEILFRDGQYWSVRVIEVEAPNEAAAVLATQEAVRLKTTQRARITRIRSLGGGEWVAEVLVLVVFDDAEQVQFQTGENFFDPNLDPKIGAEREGFGAG